VSAPLRSRVVLATLGTAAAVAALGACLDVATGPGGATNMRLFPIPPSVVVGDTLRDSTGAVFPMQAEARDADDQVVADAVFRFFYLPLRRDTSRTDVDSALVVDETTGIVRAPAPPRQAEEGRVAVELGPFQLVDTLAIVLPPDTLSRVSAADTALRLEYVCNDVTPTARSDSNALTNGVRIGNVTTPLSVALRTDSAGQTLPVARYLVRYEIVAPTNIPSGPVPGSGVDRPAIHMTQASADRPLGYDTTATDGNATARLRVVPTLLTRAAFPDSVTEVRIRASALVKRDTVPAPVEFVVRLQRRSVGLVDGQPLACP
jgi:hypothetical protein